MELLLLLYSFVILQSSNNIVIEAYKIGIARISFVPRDSVIAMTTNFIALLFSSVNIFFRFNFVTQSIISNDV